MMTCFREQLERMARAEDAATANTSEDPGPSETATDCEGEGNEGQDHPEGFSQKLCVRPPFGNWRNKNKKFVAVKGLPKIKCSFRPIYREMLINDNSYKVIKVAGWMRTHPSRTLEDYDRYQVARREDSTNFWRNFKRSSRLLA
uniref:Uncharacterized protein n=1 Tax=Oryza rufipogon TaxID=4529 RepID=A0A0E0PXS2_ORYRU